MSKKDGIDLTHIDYRLCGFTVKEVLDTVDWNIKCLNDILSTAPLSKGVFYNFLKYFFLEKDFRSYSKDHKGSEEELYIPYVKTFMYELRESLRKCVRIFETEEEDRTNKRHRKCILNMLPILREFGIFYIFLSVRLYNTMSKDENFSDDLKSKDFCRLFKGVRHPKASYVAKKGGWRIGKGR